MSRYFAGNYDVVVIGAGHAGIEAALAAARLSCDTAIFTMNLDCVANLPCNPSIGGTAKGHLVREIDALGGEMGKAADKCMIQSRMLNRGKGPAVHSLRAQIDRRAYSAHMKSILEKQENLDLKQAEIVAIERKDDTWLVITRLGATYNAKAVILATGTYLKGRIFVGDVDFESGPDGLFPSAMLADSLNRLGLPMRRFKTGTPARVHKDSVNLNDMEIQYGDEPVIPFSFETEKPGQNKIVCHLTYTNNETKQVILKNLTRSALYGGKIEGVGPRYCPSIEDKIVRFSEKERHPLFVEPCGLDTKELYLQGMSSSLPEDVQIAFYRTIKGLENVKIMRNAYAIEYDCVDPLALKPTLEAIAQPNLYGAGQFNGSSGYEEAAAQGLIAGINAARKIKGLSEVVIDRSQAYIGTLIDDLVTKGCMDPYRMMTSRSEYRLVLRQDNADARLTPLGYDIGLISERRWEAFCLKKTAKEAEMKRLWNTIVPPSEKVNALLVSRETSPLSTGIRLIELLKRPQLDYDILGEIDENRPEIPDMLKEHIEVEAKYEGYIKRQQAQIDEMLRLEKSVMPKDVDYNEIPGLRIEAKEKLTKLRPHSIGQAGRISGVSPADIQVLMLWFKAIINK